MNSYHIVTASNENFAQGLIFLSKSISRTWKSNASAQLTVLDHDLSEETKKLVLKEFEAASAEFTIDFISVGKLIPAGLPGIEGGDDRSHLMPYARLWIPNYIKNKDVLYCDSDFMFAMDPKDLIDYCRSKEAKIAAVFEEHMTINDDCAWKSTLSELQRKSPYFNSGLMYWNLENPCFQNLAERSMELLTSTECRPRFSDQTVLNYLFIDQVCGLPQKYNNILSLTPDLTHWNGDCNIHFTGPIKPFFSQSHPERAAANLIFRQLTNSKFDLEKHIAQHYNLRHKTKHLFDVIRYTLFNRRHRLEDKKRLHISAEKLRNLSRNVTEFEANDWSQTTP